MQIFTFSYANTNHSLNEIPIDIVDFIFLKKPEMGREDQDQMKVGTVNYGFDDDEKRKRLFYCL